MRKSKFLAVLLIFCLTFVIISPAVYAAQDEGHKGRSADSSVNKGGPSHDGTSKGKGGSGKDHSTGTSPTDEGDEHEHEDGESKEEEGGSGHSADKKGAIGKGGQGKGGINGGAKKGASKKEIGGTILLKVTVEWPEGTEHPDEVDVTLFREEVPNTVTTIDGVATIYSEASGDCTLVGEAVPGFTVPEMDMPLTGNFKEVFATLKYEVANTSVTGVSLNKTSLNIIRGYTEAKDRQLEATVLPENANNRNVTWSSSDEAVATVEDGLVTGKTSGTATVTVTTEENSKTDECVVAVSTIESLVDPEKIVAKKGELVVLPKTVVGNLISPDNPTTTKDLKVVWQKSDGTPIDFTYQIPFKPEEIPPIHNDYNIALMGYVDGCETPVMLKIKVDMQGKAVPVEGVSLSVENLADGEEFNNLLSLEVGDKKQLVATITPENATTKDVFWTSSEETVATVDETGLVTAVSNGFTTITVETVDGGYKAYCQVAVTVVPETVYIFPTKEDGITADKFDDRNDVYINVENLIAKLKAEFEAAEKDYPAEGIKYFVKVEDKDNAKLLGEGEVIIYGNGTTYVDLDGNPLTEENGYDTNEFNLYAATKFEETQSYSGRYFLSMSQDNRYPADDEKTLKANFVIGGTTPIIPTENVQVTTQMFGGNTPTEGLIFLLCREISDEKDGDGDGIITWKDYYLEDIPKNPYPEELTEPKGQGPNTGVYLGYFSDEVKMIGRANESGVVGWLPPRETLKLGGYYLLEVTPNGYRDNLNMYNPESSDGELLMEVHLVRNGSVERHVINTYVGN